MNLKLPIAIYILSLSLSSCTGTPETTNETIDNLTPDTLSLASSVMDDGGVLPATYTCDSDGISPPLSWSNAPEGTVEYAVVMHHEAGPDDIHWYWIMHNIDANINNVNANESQGSLGGNSVNDLNEYAPPCSKGPGEKAYTFTLYALSEVVDLSSETRVDRNTLLSAIEHITLESSELSVSYERESVTDTSRCETIQQSISNTGFNDRVEVTCDDEFAYISSDTYPDHDLMNGITGTNEQIPVPATNYSSPIKLNPQVAAELTTIDAALGVAINGVPIYDYSSQGELDVYNYSPNSDTVLLGQLDNCGGHAGRGDDYHYHASPNCMINAIENISDDTILGWAYDGYPIYGDNNPDGSLIADGSLDVCNGQADGDFGYRYHTSTKPPYIVQCLVGEVDTSTLPRVAPLRSDNPDARADLRPPSGGVQNLTHTVSADGARTMTYEHEGEQFYVTYSPSSTQNFCYDFEQKTVSNGGIIETGVFCRDDNATPGIPPEMPQEGKFKMEAWSDNWFAAYLESELIIEDSVSINTERSFNAETTHFDGEYPLQLNFILKDFKENDTGLEYIGANNQQMGDGGFIMQITDTQTDQVISVSNQDWKCQVIHQAPLDKTCEAESNPIVGVGPCTFLSSEEPESWKSLDFDDSLWANATEHTAAAVGPKDGYDEINWDSSAQLIWGSDLEIDNTLLCRVTVQQP